MGQKKRHLPRRGRRLIFFEEKFHNSRFQNFLRGLPEMLLFGLQLAPAVVDPGEGPGGPQGPSYCWTKVRPKEPKKKFFFKTGPPLSQGLDDCPPPHLI